MLKLEAQKREISGKDPKDLREGGLIPGEMYGHGFENVHIAVSSKEFKSIFKQAGESTIVTLAVDGKEYPVIIYDVQRDALKDEFSSIDFYRVHMDEKIKTRVPLVFVGEAPAVKEKGGVLIKSVEEVEVEALPGNLPHQLEIDLSSLTEIHQSLHGKDIRVPEGVRLFIEPEMGIATVIEQQKEEVVEAPKEEAAVEGAEIAEGAEGAQAASAEIKPEEIPAKQK
jgi:large subunit ribosomal protein L25